MKVKEVTLTTAPTIVIDKDYIKAGASVTVVSEGETSEELIKKAKQILNKAYKEALRSELINVSNVQKLNGKLEVIRWLKGGTDGKA